jgi:1,4-alpha-glucan branching enzyme
MEAWPGNDGLGLRYGDDVNLIKEDFIMIEKEITKGRRKKSTGEKKENHDSKEVEFIFYAPEAKEVFLAGEFNQWDTRSLPMKKEKDGVWKQKIQLTPGRYEYKIFVDGAWFEDIKGEEVVSNPFGTQNLVRGVQ